MQLHEFVIALAYTSERWQGRNPKAAMQIALAMADEAEAALALARPNIRNQLPVTRLPQSPPPQPSAPPAPSSSPMDTSAVPMDYPPVPGAALASVDQGALAQFIADKFRPEHWAAIGDQKSAREFVDDLQRRFPGINIQRDNIISR